MDPTVDTYSRYFRLSSLLRRALECHCLYFSDDADGCSGYGESNFTSMNTIEDTPDDRGADESKELNNLLLLAFILLLIFGMGSCIYCL